MSEYTLQEVREFLFYGKSEAHGKAAIRTIDAAIANEVKLHARIAKYRARLEVDHIWVGTEVPGQLQRVECEDDAKYDGIACRDETIKQLEARVAELRTAIDILQAQFDESASLGEQAIARIAELEAGNTAVDRIVKYRIPIYEVDFGDDGKVRYVMVRDFNRITTELEAQIKLHSADTISLTNELNEWRDRANAAEAAGAQGVPQGWIVVPDIGALVSADHPQTCLNPDKQFEVYQVQCDGTGWFVRGENTCWFGLKLITAAPSAPAVFENKGDSEANFIADAERLNCPSCGGSGHVDDVTSAPSRECEWSEVGEMWETTCGHAFVLNDGTPSENEMRFCCYCGGELAAPVAENAAKEEK